MIRPVDGPLSQGFGDNPTSKILPGSADYWIIEQFGNYQPDGHTGEDYPVPVGTPIRSVTSGTVIHVGNRSGTYLDNEFWIAPAFAGYHYVINHDPAPGFPNGFIGIYAHGKDGGARVKAGQRVSEGQVIGLSGNTGGSTGPHLHFEILPDQFVVNSYMYGRVNPERLFSTGGAAIGPQGTITPSKEPFTVGQYEEINDKLDAIARTGQNTWAGIWTGGAVDGFRSNYGVLPIVAESQRRDAVNAAQIKGLIGAIAAMAKGEPLDQAKLLAGVQAAAEAGVKAGIQDGTVTVDVNVAGKQ